MSTQVRTKGGRVGFFSDALAAGREAAERPERERAARLSAALAAASPADTFGVALGAAYRNVFLAELGVARVESRPPAYLFLAELPPDEVAAVGKFLRRDFDVAGADDVRQTLGTLQDLLDSSGLPAEASLWIARASWVGFAAVGLGLVDLDEVRDRLVPFVGAALDTFDGWADYGDAFLGAEEASPASNPLGRRALRRSVRDLLRTPGSPWLELPWPSADEAQGL